jgi:hypothetical protein
MAEQADEDTPPSRSCGRPSRPNWHGRQPTTLTTCSYRAHGGRCAAMPSGFAVCVAVAGVIPVVDRHWFSDWRAGRPVAAQFVSWPPRNPPATTIPAPSYSLVPAAEHLQPPAATGPVADAKRPDRPTADGPHRLGCVLCDRQRPQHPRRESGDAKGPSTASVYAYGMVYSAVAAYWVN